MFFRIINRFLTRTHSIVHFEVTLNMLKHTVFCAYMYTHNHSYTHTTYIHAYIQTYTYTYILIHSYTMCITHTYLHICTYLLVFTYVNIPFHIGSLPWSGAVYLALLLSSFVCSVVLSLVLLAHH